MNQSFKLQTSNFKLQTSVCASSCLVCLKIDLNMPASSYISLKITKMFSKNRSRVVKVKRQSIDRQYLGCATKMISKRIFFNQNPPNDGYFTTSTTINTTKNTVTRKSKTYWSRHIILTLRFAIASRRHDLHLFQSHCRLHFLCDTGFRPEVVFGRENISNTERSCRSRVCEV